jgi:hypothetical protein
LEERPKDLSQISHLQVSGKRHSEGKMQKSILILLESFDPRMHRIMPSQFLLKLEGFIANVAMNIFAGFVDQ